MSGGDTGGGTRVPWIVAALLLAVGLGAGPGSVEAQPAGAGPAAGRAWLPVERYFTVPAAAPREPRFTAGLVTSDLLSPPADTPGRPDYGLVDGDAELQGVAGMGGSFPLWRPARWSAGGVTVGIQTGIWGRFRMENSANELLGTDWVVALPLEARHGDLSARGRLVHWSAHLGDEYVDATGAERLDFTHEAVELLVAWDEGPVTLYGGGSVILRSQLEDASDAPPGFTDAGHVQVGADARTYPWAGGRLGLRGAVDLQWADRTDSRPQLAGSLAFEGRDDAGRRVRVGLMLFDGPSPLGQFFRNEESYWGLEIRIDP